MYVWLITTVPHLVDHVQGALEDSVKDLGYLTGDVSPQLVDNGCHGTEDLRLTGSGNIALVVNEDGVQQWWNKVLPYLEKQWEGSAGINSQQQMGQKTQPAATEMALLGGQV